MKLAQLQRKKDYSTSISYSTLYKFNPVNICLRKGPFPLVRFNPRGYPRGCHIIQPSLNPCIISIHEEPARVICRAGRKSNNVRFFPHRMAKTHGEFQKKTSHRWAFPCIAACFAKFVRINPTWTYNHLIICKYGKRNPIFNTIKRRPGFCLWVGID